MTKHALTYAYLQSAGQGATPTRMVVMLYEQLIHDIQRALAAMQNRDVERRTAEISHAIEVLGVLQGTLDLERGGEVSRNLDRFYSLMRASLLQAQIRVSADILRKQLQALLDLRQAWVNVDAAEAESPADVSLPGVASTAEGRSVRWSG